MTLRNWPRELAATPGWVISDGQLTRTVTGENFRDSLLFVNAVGFLAERANHHPDISISWNKVTLQLVTHSAGRADGGRLRPGPADQPAVLSACW